MCVGRCVKGRGQSGAFVCSTGPAGYVSVFLEKEINVNTHEL